MRVIDPVVSYDLAGGNGLVFLQMEDGWIVRDGTTNEEVLELMIQRIAEGYTTIPCGETNACAVPFARSFGGAASAIGATHRAPTSKGPADQRTPVVESMEAPPAGIGSHQPDARRPLPAALAALEVCIRHPPRRPS